MMAFRNAVLLLIVLCHGAFAGVYPSPKANCERYQACNGQMCTDICRIGTVELDTWATAALAFQREIQRNRTLDQVEQVGVHNGAIAQDYGMGIEEEFLYNLLLPIYGEEKSFIVIANQKHSLYDQLRMGVRHVEVDIYYFERLGGIRVCHWPVCPPDFYLIVQNAAKRQGIELDWDCGNLGCDEGKPFFLEMMQEVRKFMDENKEEVVTIYLDSKNLRKDEIPILLGIIQDTFGDILFTAEEKVSKYGDRWPTINQMLENSDRILFEIGTEEWVDDPEASAVLFIPTIWDPYQFGPDAFKPYPNCTVKDDFTYGISQTRSLDGSLTLGPAFLWEGREDYPPEMIQQMGECSVTIQSIDQVHPMTMKNFVWSWQQNQPDGSSPCAVMASDGRWRSASSCDLSLRHACVSLSDETSWVLSSRPATFDQATCPSGYEFGRPITGYANARLREVANGEEIWINQYSL